MSLWSTRSPASPDERFPSPPEPEKGLKPILRGVWEGGEVYEVDSLSGGLATEYTPEETRVTRAVTSVHSILQWVNKQDPRGPIPEHPASDPQYRLWEYGVRKWAAENGFIDGARSQIRRSLIRRIPFSRCLVFSLRPLRRARSSQKMTAYSFPSPCKQHIRRGKQNCSLTGSLLLRLSRHFLSRLFLPALSFRREHARLLLLSLTPYLIRERRAARS